MIITKSTFRKVLLLLFFIKGLILFGQSSTYSTTLDFNGSDSYITIPSDINDLKFNSDKFTLEAWIKIENAPASGSDSGNNSASNRDYIFAKKNDWSLYVLNINGSLYFEGRFRRDYHGNWPDVRSSSTISLNTWYHVAFTNSKSDGRIRIYINGNLNNSENWTSEGYGLTSTTNPIGIGASVWDGIDNPSNFFDGEMSDIRFWESERTQSEINLNKNSSLSTTSNLKLYYKLNEGSGASINDSSGNSITGTAKGSYQWKINTGPTLTLTDTDSNNVISNSDVVTITATFSESMMSTPTLSLTGVVSSAIMNKASGSGVTLKNSSLWNSGEPNNSNSGTEAYGMLQFSGNLLNDTTPGHQTKYVLEVNSNSITSISGFTYLGSYGTHNYFYSDSSFTWENANQNSIVNGGYLAVINSNAELDFLKSFSYSGASIGVFLGFYQDSNDPNYSEPDGGWKWVDDSSSWTYTWTVSGSTINSTIATVSGIDIFGNAYSGTDSITFTIDNSVPTVNLSDTDSDNIVAGSNLVTITATFSESMATTPTINITGEVSNALMTASSTASVWIYPWTVSATTSGIVSATVSGADLAGNTYSGSDSITFTIDNSVPTLSIIKPSGTYSNQSVVVTLTYDEAITGLTTDTAEFSEATNVASLTLISISSDFKTYVIRITPNSDGLVKLTHAPNSPPVKDLAGNPISSIVSCSFIYDITPPTLSLTDTDSDNIVSGSNVVTFTATFSESMTPTPTINISGEVSNALMTASSTANVWIYPWTVSTTTSGIVSATVSGMDLAGNAYSGTDSVTFNIDNTLSQISTSGLTSDNLFLNITFNKDVYSDVINGLGSNTLEVSDFELSLTSNSSLTLSSQNPESITQSGTTYILKVPAVGYANGTEILILDIPNNKIFDITGNIFTSTLSFTLNNNLLVDYDFSNTNSYNGNTTSASNKSISNLSGNSNDGEIKGISNVYYDSFNDAIYFDGDSGGEKGIAISDLKYVSGDSDQINELTILSRIKLSSTTSNHNNDQRILFSFDRSSVFRFSVGSDQNSSSAGKLAFHFANSDKHSGSSNGSHDTYAVSQTIDLRDDNWHDVAVTFEANTPNGLKFYVDNNLVYSHPDSFKPISNQTDNETPRYGWVGNGSESSSAGSSTGPDHLFLGYVQSLKYYNKQLSQSFLNDIDRSGPNVQLSDTDADNLVSVSNVVTVTALFSESLIADPTISITGTVTNVSMTSSSTANTWFYTWVVEESFDGIGYATVSGSDTSGNTYTGTDSITFKDLNPPGFSGTSVQNQNEYVDLSFDQPIYGNSNAITGLTSSSFTIVQTSGSSLTLNILGFRANNSSTFSSASQLSGGETTVRIFMDLSNLNPEGNETYSVSATNSSSIFDLNGNGMLTSQSASFTLNIPISGPVDPNKSTITLAPVDLIANSLNIATIIVQAKDSLGQNFNSGGNNVVIFNDSGDLKTIDNQNGTYSFNYAPEIPTSDSQDITFGFRVEEIIGDQTAKLIVHRDDDKDGVYNINDVCPRTDTDLVVNATGCALNQLDSDNDGVFDDVDECPDTPEFELNNVQGTPTFGEQIPTVVDPKGCGASQRDTDGDGIVDTEDNCIDTSNSDQLDTDDDGIGDVCDTDNPLPDIISTEIKFIQLPPNGSIVGKINATDPDGEALKFTQIGSNFTGVLSVATDGTVSVSSGPLLSFDSIYNGAILSFSVSDGENKVPGSVRILIEDAPRPPEISIVTLEISEDAEVGTIVGFVEAKDPMGGQIVSIDLQGDGFIELDSGVLKTTQELDYETTTAHSFTITAKASDRTDFPGLTGSKSESVRVVDIPNMTYTGRFFISIFNVEDESVGAKVDFRRFYNPHNKNVGKWKIKKKIKGGADASKFTIKSGSTEVQQKSNFPPVVDENEDYLAFITPPDYENPGDANKDNIYEVEVEYINTDDGAPEVPIVVTQSIIQVPEGKVTTIELQSQPVLATDDNDGDGVVDILDNSPLVSNPDQGDEDGDGVGDVTDDSDQDGVWNPFDICLNTPLGEIVDLDGCLIYYLPASNFSISKTEKCAGENSINLVVQDDTVAYKVNVNGATSVSESFTGSSWSLDKLSAGVYYVCISVEGVNPLEFERCFELTINESDPLQVNSFFNKLDQTVSFDLSGGTSYEVTHNGKTTQTTSNKHTVILDKGINNISISTGIECQGMFENTYLNSYEVKYAPNPFNEVLQLYFGGKDNLIEIGIYSTNGQLIDYQTISLPFGVRNYTLETNNYKQGVYIVKVRSETLDQSIQVIKE